MANEPKPQQGTAWCCVCGMDHSNFQGLHSFAGAPSLSSLAYRPETCPHCVAKDAEITQWKEAHDDRVDQYRELEVERDAKDQEIERLKASCLKTYPCKCCADAQKIIESERAEHAQAIQQAQQEVLEMACKAVCEWCAPESGLCPAVDVGGEEWGHPVPASEDIDPCNASHIRAAFAAKWPEEHSGGRRPIVTKPKPKVLVGKPTWYFCSVPAMSAPAGYGRRPSTANGSADRVMIGQVWEDCDKRQLSYRGEKRRVRVVGMPLIGARKYVILEALNGPNRGRRTKARLDRMRPGATGYRPVEGAQA